LLESEALRFAESADLLADLCVRIEAVASFGLVEFRGGV
jgi:hypothetical protein